MTWIKVENHIFDKPEIFEIAQILNIDPDAVVGKCIRIWSWFDQNSTDGIAKNSTKILLDRQVGIAGFCDAMISAGWMLEAGSQILLPNYERHNSGTAKTRSLVALRVAKHRAKQTNVTSVTDSVTKSLHVTQVDRYQRREDKIRKKEKINKKEKDFVDLKIDDVCLDDLSQKPPPDRKTEPIQQVFEHWKVIMQQPNAKLDAKRRRLIAQSLKLKYTPEQLCQAIDGCRESPFHMGDNDRHERYDKLELILRNADQIDKFIRHAQDPPRPISTGKDPPNVLTPQQAKAHAEQKAKGERKQAIAEAQSSIESLNLLISHAKTDEIRNELRKNRDEQIQKLEQLQTLCET